MRHCYQIVIVQILDLKDYLENQVVRSLPSWLRLVAVIIRLDQDVAERNWQPHGCRYEQLAIIMDAATVDSIICLVINYFVCLTYKFSSHLAPQDKSLSSRVQPNRTKLPINASTVTEKDSVSIRMKRKDKEKVVQLTVVRFKQYDALGKMHQRRFS